MRKLKTKLLDCTAFTTVMGGYQCICASVDVK